MATLKQRLHKRNASGAYDVLHLETSASVVLMSDGTTAEAAINDKAASVHASQHATGGSDPIDLTKLGAIPASEKGKAGGTATLGADGKVPSGQLPAIDVSSQFQSHNADKAAHNDIRTAVSTAQSTANTAKTTASTAQTKANEAASAAANALNVANSKAASNHNHNGVYAPAYSYGTTDLTAGSSVLETGKLHFVYE